MTLIRKQRRRKNQMTPFLGHVLAEKFYKTYKN